MDAFLGLRDYRLPDGAVGVPVLERIADEAAAQVWGPRVARGEPVPISDGETTDALVFPYALGAAVCPSTQELLAEVSAVRSAAEDAGAGSPLQRLAEFGRRFGSVCVSATTSGPPVRWLSHFIPDFFLLAGPAAEAAAARLGGDVRAVRYIRRSPEEQYLEFAAESATALVDAVDPQRAAPAAAGIRGTPDAGVAGLGEEIDRAWAAVGWPAPGGAGGTPRMAAAGPAPVPVGLPVERLAGAGASEVKIALWELIPWVDHTSNHWCVPTSWAMVLGFYDNYVPGKGTLTGYGRWIDHWYEATPGGANLPNLVDDVLPTHDAQAINGYTWTEVKTIAAAANQWGWDPLVAEINAGRPCFFGIKGHVMVAYGYRTAANGQRFGLVLDPPNPATPTYAHEESILNCTGISGVTVHGGDDGENVVLMSPDGGQQAPAGAPLEVSWFVWGGSTKHTRISQSADGGNTWTQVASGVATKGGWNSYALQAGPQGTRVRVKVEGITGAGALLAADASFTNLTVTPAPAGSWAQVWGPTGTALAAAVAGAADPVVYATQKASGDIYRWIPGTGWTKVGGPGKMFALDGKGTLYGLSPDGGGVYRYNATPMSWTRIGGPAGALYAGGDRLFATSPDTGDIYWYQGAPMAWTKIGGPGAGFAVDGTGRLYGMSPTGGDIYRWDGTAMAWTKVGDQATALHAGGCALYAERGPAGDLYLYSLAGTAWTKVGGPGAGFAVDGDGRAYGLTPAKDAVYRHEGTWSDPGRWTEIGGAAASIHAGGRGRLLATNPATGDLWGYA